MASGLGPVNGVLVWTEAARFRALRDFYVDTLGLAPRADRDGHVDFEWGGLRLTIAVHDDVGGPARDPLRVMINFAVEDIEAEYARLREAGVAFSRPPGRERWGGLVATFADPDGNTLQLLQLPEGP
ncbi:MAG: VOC family protein [Chloroflexi bacterium]|nr:VOC family protein [Chloroflexota bacterium]